MSPIFIRYTWKNLKENRSRTLVTIVGILLSTALVTAVLVSVSSALYYFERVAVDDVGDWSVGIYEATGTERDRLAQDGRVDELCALRSVGYAQLEEAGRPYLFVGAMSENFAGRMPIDLIRGRMPENDTELLVTRQFLYNSGLELSPGDTLTLSLGSRLTEADGRLNQHESFREASDSAPERFEADGRVAVYTVTGIYEEPEFEPSRAAGYTALTLDVPAAGDRTQPESGGPAAADEGAGGVYELWIQLRDMGQAQSFLREKLAEGFQGETNWTLLKYSGYSGSSSMELLYGMAGILTVMVAAGSVALIYNAFSISVTERIRQFGLLKSLGATRRQIMGSVLTEGLMLCVVGVPLGILTGCLGIGATVWGCQDLFETALGGFSESVVFVVHPTVKSLLLSAGLAFLTVLLSAWLPARRALRMTAIEAIRQNQEVQIRPGRVRTGPVTLRLFGLEGLLASKNFKRSRKRYRATIFSLFFSIVLFVSANSFCHYLRKSMEDSRGTGTYDLAYYMWDAPEKFERMYAELRGLEGVDDSALTEWQSMNVAAVPEDMTAEFRAWHDAEWRTPWAGWGVVFVEDEDYRAYLAENGLDAAVYMDTEHPAALVLDRMVDSSGDHGYRVYDVLRDGVQSLSLLLPEGKEGYGRGQLQMTEQGVQVLYYKNDAEGGEEPLKVPMEEAVRTIEVAVGTRMEGVPWFCTRMDRPQLLLPAGMRDAWGLEADWTAAFFRSGDYNTVCEKMRELTRESGGVVSNNAQSAMETRALLGLIEVFSTGFLALISLIATANVFNTISTNVLLRRREFAMLRSIGMTRRGTRRILNYECLLYGCKSVLYAAPVSLGITYIIYNYVKRQGFFMGFYIPWQTLATVVLAVFLVVFATMLYADRKLGREELAGEIREENA